MVDGSVGLSLGDWSADRIVHLCCSPSHLGVGKLEHGSWVRREQGTVSSTEHDVGVSGSSFLPPLRRVFSWGLGTGCPLMTASPPASARGTGLPKGCPQAGDRSVGLGPAATRHPWLPGRERLKEGIEHDAQLIRRIMLQQAPVPAPADQKNLASLWFWYSLYVCWAESQPGPDGDTLRGSYVAHLDDGSGEPSRSGDWLLTLAATIRGVGRDSG